MVDCVKVNGDRQMAPVTTTCKQSQNITQFIHRFIYNKFSTDYQKPFHPHLPFQLSIFKIHVRRAAAEDIV